MSIKREWYFEIDFNVIRSSDGLFPEISIYAKISSEFQLKWECFIINHKGYESSCTLPYMSWLELKSFLEEEYPVIDEKNQKILKLKRTLEFLNEDTSELENLILSNKDKIKNIQNEILELEKT